MRRLLAYALTATLLVAIAPLAVFASHDTDPTVESSTPQANDPAYWEALGYGVCEKLDEAGNGPVVLDDSETWTLLLFKQANENTYWENPVPGHGYYDGQEWSHRITCWDDSPLAGTIEVLPACDEGLTVNVSGYPEGFELTVEVFINGEFAGGAITTESFQETFPATAPYSWQVDVHSATHAENPVTLSGQEAACPTTTTTAPSTTSTSDGSTTSTTTIESTTTSNPTTTSSESSTTSSIDTTTSSDASTTDPTLPFTGSEDSNLGWLALALIATGLTIITLGRSVLDR